MYLGPAVKLAIPYAILDREELERAFGYEGPEAEEAKTACAELKKLQGLKPAQFTEDQRETARLALLWGEQYLEGYMDAIKDSNKAELALSRKHWRQIRRVRFEHFGKTIIEAMCEKAVSVDVYDIFNRKTQT